MVLRNLTVRSTILQQIRCNRSRKAKDRSKSRSSTHLLLGSEAPWALDQSTTGRQLKQSHLNGGNSRSQIRLYTSPLWEGYKGGRMNQYWSLIGAVLVRSMYQYWSEPRPVLVWTPTSTGQLSDQYWLKNPPYIRGFQQAPLPYSPSLGGTWYIYVKREVRRNIR